MREFCNVAYVAQIENMEEKDLKKFDRELNADPGGPPVSHGTRDLLAFMSSPLGRTGEGRRT